MSLGSGTSRIRRSQAMDSKPDNRTLLTQLILCILFFYMLIFSISSILFGAFEFDRLMNLVWTAFGHESDVDNEDVKIASLIAICCTYLICSIHWPYFISRRFWDFAVTTWLQYLAIGCIIRRDVVRYWPWWVANILSLLLSILIGEGILFYKRRRTRKSRL
ncbi:putative transmembrane protein 244 [Symsagittifera roscoffensis]|uniref:putative transmembrane protein 244 n=1 Tax=Symsagittifera roscoffensis TaxID=84072 RepID=UPI00307B391E